MESSDSHLESTNGEDRQAPPCPCRISGHISGKTSWEKPIPPLLDKKDSTTVTDNCSQGTFEDIDLDASANEPTTTGDYVAWSTIENITALGLSFSVEDSPIDALTGQQRFSLDDPESKDFTRTQPPTAYRFEKWMKTLQKKAMHRRLSASDGLDIAAAEGDRSGPEFKEPSRYQHKKSSSGSSLGFVTAVKSASISLASFSMAQRSRRTAMSSRYQRTDRSSRASNGAIRLSEDSSYPTRSAVMDAAVNSRSIQRRQIIEEIISTEEGYIADIRFLTNVYVTLLASIPTISSNLRNSINQNLNEIVELHEEILGDLHRVVPHSEYNQTEYARFSLSMVDENHRRMRSLDTVPSPGCDISLNQKVPSMTAEASIGAEVARVFGQKMHRFFIYEEYGAKYETMVKDVASTYRTIPQWNVYQKGLEALATSLASINSQNQHHQKSLTVGDLLVKVDAFSKNAFRALGHVYLCGVLHVAWQTRSGVDGQYMISLLYRDCLILATAGKDDQTYHIKAIIGLSEVRAEEADNGRGKSFDTRRDGQAKQWRCSGLRPMPSESKAFHNQDSLSPTQLTNLGLQCHTAPFSWKIVFECDHQLYEIMLSACSPKEELEWRSRLNERASREQSDTFEHNFFTSSSIEIRPMGTVFGKPGTIARRISIHRATTIGPKSPLCQVIIKNTTALKDISHSISSATINRSQSLLTTNRIPVLAPSRAERVRLENLLSDVWTRDILPFPGMTGRARSEHLVRVSASSMMRKLSVASITSNFTKRSASFASLSSIQRPTDEKQDLGSIRTLHREGREGIIRGWDSIVPEASWLTESDEVTAPRLSVIKDENFPFEEKVQALANATNADSSVGALKRLATLRVKRSWQPEGSRIITPPLRTSSANSISQNRPALISEIPCDGHENQHQSKHGMWAKAAGMNKSMYTEGIRGFFR